MENILTPLVESVLVSLELMVTALATGTAIQKKIFGSGTTTLITSNEDFNSIMKFIKSLKNFDL